MDSILAKLPRQKNGNVLIGFHSSDDAGVYQLTKDLSLVQTVDFLTPIVDDPFTFGQIAAANSLSDIYAMGGKPISSLAIICFPTTLLPEKIFQEILRGGLEKMEEAGCVIIGGHSINDDEIKFGYAVNGVINSNKIMANKGARPGDQLILTKKLGTGIIATTLKRLKASKAAISESVNSMLKLNKRASELSIKFGAHAITDITGFGLLGHGRELALASEVSIQFDHKKIEFLPQAQEYSREKHLAGGLKNNKEFLKSYVEISPRVPEDVENLLYDPQTSGGLLISVEEHEAQNLFSSLAENEINSQIIGKVTAKTSPLLSVI